MDHRVEVSGCDMLCESPVRITKNLNPSEFPDGLLVPCGKCLLCKIHKRKEWSLRMLHELSYYDDSIFITLTYNDDHLPENNSLVKNDLVKFFKRLRRDLSRSEKPRSIKYFACGEYGSEEFTERPHYHAIIFGLSLSVYDKQLISSNWSYGFVSFGIAEADSIRYVAQYIDKKYYGDMEVEKYTNTGRIPVFKLSSLGMGKRYCEEHREQLTQLKHITLNGVKHSIPRYYLDKLGLPREEMHQNAEEAEKDVVEYHTGVRTTRDDWYRNNTSPDIMKLEKGISDSKKQSTRNVRAKIDMRTKRHTQI